jgi:predicted acetyltransferase|tara:strand:- start:152 stop:655 length:504 start_codon:yes stop_codon:yes gene_type:complete
VALKNFFSLLAKAKTALGELPSLMGSSLEEYLTHLVEKPDPLKTSQGRVPQTTFWMLSEAETAVGMLRMRHYLNDKLLHHGGHIGYFVQPLDRGKGYGKNALRLALTELARLGEKRALLTVDADNYPSVRVIEFNGESWRTKEWTKRLEFFSIGTGLIWGRRSHNFI